MVKVSVLGRVKEILNFMEWCEANTIPLVGLNCSFWEPEEVYLGSKKLISELRDLPHEVQIGDELNFFFLMRETDRVLAKIKMVGFVVFDGAGEVSEDCLYIR